MEACRNRAGRCACARRCVLLDVDLLTRRLTLTLSAITAVDGGERGFAGGNRRRGEENEELRGVDGREVQNQHAIKVIQRIQDKLTGRDFKASVVLPIDVQVQKLIEQATSMENLCQCFIGWCTSLRPPARTSHYTDR
jgi:hypothetical protein